MRPLKILSLALFPYLVPTSMLHASTFCQLTFSLVNFATYLLFLKVSDSSCHSCKPFFFYLLLLLCSGVEVFVWKKSKKWGCHFLIKMRSLSFCSQLFFMALKTSWTSSKMNLASLKCKSFLESINILFLL